MELISFHATNDLGRRQYLVTRGRKIAKLLDLGDLTVIKIPIEQLRNAEPFEPRSEGQLLRRLRRKVKQFKGWKIQRPYKQIKEMLS